MTWWAIALGIPSLVRDLTSSAMTLSRAASMAATISSTVACRLVMNPLILPQGVSGQTVPRARPALDLDFTSVPRYGPDKIHNVAILGHSHDGKTTLAEALLHATATIARM